MKARPVAISQVTMTELVLPSHTNSMGTIFGGTIMSWMDIAAAICAQRHAQKPVVTVHVDDLEFIAPVYKGWVVNLKASVNHTGRTSMEVGVRIDAENPMTNETFHTASAYLTFVALDSHGKPTQIPPIEPQTAEEKERFAAGALRRTRRLQRKEQAAKSHRSK
jgi:acyl-CoA hydrolase